MIISEPESYFENEAISSIRYLAVHYGSRAAGRRADLVYQFLIYRSCWIESIDSNWALIFSFRAPYMLYRQKNQLRLKPIILPYAFKKWCEICNLLYMYKLARMDTAKDGTAFVFV